MTEHDGLIDLSLTEPGALFSGWEDLHCHIAPPPTSAPHLSKTPLSNDLLQDDGSGHGPLDKQRQTCSEEMRMETSVNYNTSSDQQICYQTVTWPEPEPDVERS